MTLEPATTQGVTGRQSQDQRQGRQLTDAHLEAPAQAEINIPSYGREPLAPVPAPTRCLALGKDGESMLLGGRASLQFRIGRIEFGPDFEPVQVSDLSLADTALDFICIEQLERFRQPVTPAGHRFHADPELAEVFHLLPHGRSRTTQFSGYFLA